MPEPTQCNYHYLLRTDADEALRRLGELRHLIDEYNEWQTAIRITHATDPDQFTRWGQERADWHEDIVDLATEIVGL